MHWANCGEILKRKNSDKVADLEPKKRWGHSCVAIPGNKLLIIGGYEGQYLSDVWEYKFSKFQYERVNAAGENLLLRSNHSSVYDKNSNSVYIFGGGTSGRHRFNDVLRLDLEKKELTEVQVLGELPCPRTYHAATLVADRYMVIIGGEGKEDLNDVYVLDLQTMKWNKPKVEGDKLPPRRFHSVNCIDNKVYVFGGCHKDYRNLNDFYVFDFEQFVLNQGSVECKRIDPFGEVPSKRWGHSADVLNGKLYMFGGRNDKDLNDFWAFSPEKNAWKKLESVNTPCPRRRACTVFVGSAFVLFGGFDSQFYNDMHYVDIFGKKDSKMKLTKSTIARDFYRMIDKENYNTISFKATNGVIKANKGLLLYRYIATGEELPPVLKKVFFGNTDIEIDLSKSNVNVEDVKRMIGFLYSGNFSENLSIAEAEKVMKISNELELFLVSSKIQSKISQAQSYLKRILNVQNAAPPAVNINQQKVDFSKLEVESPEEANGKSNQKVATLSAYPYSTFEDNSDLTTSLDKFYDILFKVENRLVRANKLVLIERCEYFRRMFDNSHFKESQENVIEINDIPALHFSAILQFLYTDSLTLFRDEPEFFIELLIYADAYFLDRLVDLCSLYLKNHINSQTVCQILLIAYHYNAKNLEDYCLNFLAMNEYIYEDPDFEKWADKVDSNLFETFIEKVEEIKRKRIVKFQHLKMTIKKENIKQLKKASQKGKNISKVFSDFFDIHSYILESEKDVRASHFAEKAREEDFSKIPCLNLPSAEEDVAYEPASCFQDEDEATPQASDRSHMNEKKMEFSKFHKVVPNIADEGEVSIDNFSPRKSMHNDTPATDFMSSRVNVNKSNTFHIRRRSNLDVSKFYTESSIRNESQKKGGCSIF